MRRMQRLISAFVLIALSSAVAGCSSGFNSWDPMDMLDWLDTKKKLPGERKPVFPDGVPGLEQGVPKSLYKGTSQQEIDQNNAQAAAAAAAAPPPQDSTNSKRAAKSKSKQSTTASTDAAAPPEEDATPAAPQAPKPKKIVRQRTTAPPPDQPPADGQPAAAQPAAGQPTQQSAAPFPAPLPGGTFQR